jgi:hypothetical protein
LGGSGNAREWLIGRIDKHYISLNIPTHTARLTKAMKTRPDAIKKLVQMLMKKNKWGILSTRSGSFSILLKRRKSKPLRSSSSLQ